MFELPEFTVLAAQLNEVLPGKVVAAGELGNKPHKFVWYNRSHEEFAGLVQGLRMGRATCRGRWLFVPMEPAYVLVLGECGGRLLYHSDSTTVPKTYHLLLHLEDGAALSLVTQMWGAVELYAQGDEQERQYIKGMRPTPADTAFTRAYFDSLLDELAAGKKRSVKSLLTQEQLVPGLGNAIAQDIMFQAGLHPRHPLTELAEQQRRILHDAILETVQEVTRQGGRHDEIDLHGDHGRYVRRMDKHAAGAPCPKCGAEVVKTQYLGGACYFCPDCQT
jgi:formamidopyrimidine-DNA glycosylase